MNTQPVLPDLIRQIIESGPMKKPDGRSSPRADRCTARLRQTMEDGKPRSIQTLAIRFDLSPKQMARAVRSLRIQGDLVEVPNQSPAVHPWSKLYVVRPKV